MTKALAAASLGMLLSIDQIAEVAHEVNRAYCASLGDESQPSWAEAPDWQKQSALAGVKMHLANPDATTEQSHESWLAQKVADGWVYGEVKDAEKKQHPCCVPYDQLPLEQKTKDYLFRGIVHALAVFPAPAPAAKAAPADAPAAGMVAVKYIGHREIYREGAYGTGIVFTKGETKLVPAAKAALMLKHPDVYVAGAAPAAAVATQGAATKAGQNVEEEHTQDLRDSVQHMTKAACKAFVQTHFKQDLDDKLKLDDMRAKAIQLIDQFGVA